MLSHNIKLTFKISQFLMLRGSQHVKKGVLDSWIKLQFKPRIELPSVHHKLPTHINGGWIQVWQTPSVATYSMEE